MALLARKERELPHITAPTLQRRVLEGDRSGLIVFCDPQHRWPMLEEAVARVAPRYAEKLDAGWVDHRYFKKLIGRYCERNGYTREALLADLPFIGLVRAGELVVTLFPTPLFRAPGPALRSLEAQIDAFVQKMVLHYVPKEKGTGDDGKGGVPERGPVNPDKRFPVRATIAGRTHAIELPENEILLDGFIEREIQMDYSCRQGMCDSCTVRILRGAENLNEPTKQEIDMLKDELKNGKRLSCQVVVKGPVEFEQ